jgi:TPR repeat protein
MYQLGLIYDRDNENQKALFWYKKASQKGHKEAKERLAFLQEWLKNKQNIGN